MTRGGALVLLATFGVGVFLAGLELMITAVALPSIVTNLGDWTELRKASWIINAYLLVYVVTMPLAGRVADLWGSRRLFLGALVVFVVGSALAGRAQSLDELIAARLVQAVGGGVLVPVATAAASHLYGGHARPRALGVIGALTFLGMAAGPFVGAAILSSVNVEAALARGGVDAPAAVDALAPAWRWVFYLNVPIGIVALALAWAAGSGWDTPRRAGRVDVPGAVLFSAALGTALVGVTIVGARSEHGGVDPTIVGPVLLLVALAATIATVVVAFRRADPFLDPRLFRHRGFSSATIVSLLTGYGLATAIVGGALVPLLQGIRGTARFGYLAIMACAILAGFGLAAIRRRWATARWLPALTAGAIACANLDAWVAPIAYSPPGRISPVYAELARERDAVLVEIPFYPPDRTAHSAAYLLAATTHWRPILNGYSGLVPPSYVAHYEQLRGFPDPGSLDALARLGVTHVVVHADDTRKWMGVAALESVRHTERLQLMTQDGDVAVYRLRR